jgi:hypothetical protein
MTYCPNCNEDGEESVECWRCGKSKCEDCATRDEVTSQCCNECAHEMVQSSKEKVRRVGK